MSDEIRRIAMWSGPRNISTALMRSWGNRPDTAVWDEPFYAHYLLATGVTHPGAEEVIRCHESDWRKVIPKLIGDVPGGKTIVYQKHMSHHFLPEIDRGWLKEVTNVFLIRRPREVVTSLVRLMPQPRLQDTGLPQQLEIFNLVRETTGKVSPVIDTRDVLRDPPRLLRLLCEAVNVPFTEAMLSWPAGPRDTDGVWAKYWYSAVLKSTTFESYRPKQDTVPEHLNPILARAEELYMQLYQHRLGK
jgi:Sulfotransferase domain